MPIIARKPSQELVDIVGALGGTWSGLVAMCRCPAHADTDPSLSIRQGDRSILVTCFAGCRREDVLRALRRVRPGRRYDPPLATTSGGTANVARIWEQAGSVGGTLAERYLDRRGLPVALVDIRFHPPCPYLPKPKTVFLPALLVAVRDAGTLVAIQRIFLHSTTAAHIRKVMLGRPLAGAWRGGGVANTLAIAEGFETAAAFTMVNMIPCWASLGARRLDQLIIPETVTTLLIAEDNDAEGRCAAAKAQRRYARPNLCIRRHPPPSQFKDWAQLLDPTELPDSR